jgi:hypothetical protein
VRYHFNTKNGERHADIDGTELSSDSAARAEAVRYAGEIMCSEPDALWVSDELKVDVTDDDGLILFSVIVLGMDSASRRSA